MTMPIFLMLLTMFLAVFLLRAFPLLVFGSGHHKIPGYFLYLGQVMTGGAIAMLVVYSLYGVLNVPETGLSRLPGALLCAGLAVGLHWRFRNPLLSIIASTALYMLLIQR
ncbi:MAG: AzlD domain-containing protein [Victivallaceae bacterium]|nr:AzlD domain-containing protein [Victivallaceae bacterium]